jgi:hypothetical protein
MLVDIVVRNHEVVVAARPTKEMAPIIILERTEGGYVLPAIKWPTGSSDGMNTRLENRVFDRLKGKALEKAFKVVRDDGGLDIAWEYGSIENKQERL